MRSARSKRVKLVRQGRAAGNVGDGAYLALADLLLRRAPRQKLAQRATADRLLAQQTLERLNASELRDYFSDDCVDAYRAKVKNPAAASPSAAVIYPIALDDRLELLVSTRSGIRQFTVAVSREVLESILQEAVLHELPSLQRGLAVLAVMGAVAPLLGLLGTVTGMIETFRIITVFGTGDPKLMSGGISEALVTTELGLAVAIPIMLLHTLLSRRADHILGDMEKQAVGMTNLMAREEAD